MKTSYDDKVQQLVEKSTKNIKEYSITLNNDKPEFQKQDYKVVEGEPIYFEPDELERSSGAIAIISKTTIPLVIKKNLKYPNPYGWNSNLENKNVFERCHIIAYSLSAKLADKRNIFIGTETLNISIMSKIEKRVHKHIMKNDVKVLYKVTIKYKGSNKIPTGILIEAQSLDDDFSVCEFCYNIQRNAKFNYKDGSIIEPRKLNIIEKVQNVVKKKEKSNKPRKPKNPNNATHNYIINRQTNEFHLKDSNCVNLKNVDSKYINETIASKKDLMKVDLKECSKCN